MLHIFVFHSILFRLAEYLQKSEVSGSEIHAGKNFTIYWSFPIKTFLKNNTGERQFQGLCAEVKKIVVRSVKRPKNWCALHSKNFKKLGKNSEIRHNLKKY
jgi:type III secretory pathway component EscR